MPNSARDLLPLLQPATKALAQMLAGRTGVSGQLNHARAMLAQAERLIAERAHNRLNPAEREEFFEQLARLRLTLADAESEAEIQAAEDETPSAPAPPVPQERLKEMALALAARAPQDKGQRIPDGDDAEQAGPAEDRQTSADGDRGQDREPDAPVEPAAEAVASAANRRAGRLELPKTVAQQAAPAIDPSIARARRARRAASSASGAGRGAGEPRTLSEERRDAGAADTERAAGNGASDQEQESASAKPRDGRRRARKAKHQGVPEGWVIDDEGFVVPGPS